ncbi:uncharacterized protein [Rutidosis leptorrhynchoides]|uniref:uncharacterized protein n=1 Tax=Rutidosis leptorrhynchoides TaxID=125765 RepID=UPI003A992344
MEKLQRISQAEDDVPVELIHLILSLLPVKEAAGTCVLSKTWSHAWSTIPHLRFHITSEFFSTEEKERDYIKFMDRTMSKYIQYNIPIQSFDLILDDIKLASLANKWIPSVAAQSCLKELSLKIRGEIDGKYHKFILTDEIFSGKNLHTLSLRAYHSSPIETVSRNPVINCVNLRVLELLYVKISEEVLDSLFSTCVLLEEINLSYCFGLMTIKVRNLHYLKEVKLRSEGHYDILQIDDVPDLHIFSNHTCIDLFDSKTIRSNVASLFRVTELSFSGMIIDIAFLDMIKYKLPFLETLYLVMPNWTLDRLDITSFSSKRMTLIIRESMCMRTDTQVCAPKLLYFSYRGETMPSLVFPSGNAPDYIKLELDLFVPNDHSFLVTMREVLNLSSKFDILINYNSYEPLNIDVDDREIRFPIPSTNVQELSLYMHSGELLQGALSFFDALLTICHPKYVKIYTDNMYSLKKCSRDFLKPIINGMMAKKMCGPKDIEFKNPVGNEKWEILTYSCPSILDRPDDFQYSLDLKLNW